MNQQERKQALLAESEINRLVLKLEIENLKSAATSGEGMISSLSSRIGWLAPILAVAGIFGEKKTRKTAGGSSFLRIALIAAPFVLRWLRSRKTASQ